MARPVRFEWDDHDWSESPHSPARASPKEKRTDPSTVHHNGNVASGES
jgi:putative transposase